MSCDMSQLPRELVIKILSFSDLDTKRKLGISPGRLQIPEELEFGLDTILRCLWNKGVYKPFTQLFSPSERPGFHVPMYTISYLPDLAHPREQNARYLVRTQHDTLVIYESVRLGLKVL